MSTVEDYRMVLGALSNRLVDLQRPIRILDSIKWDDSIPEFLRKTAFHQLPPLDPEYYGRNPLRFDPSEKKEKLQELTGEIAGALGKEDALGGILSRNAQQYHLVVEMLEQRGTPKFYEFSKRLYGSSMDTFLDGKSTVEEFGEMLYSILQNLDDRHLGTSFERNIPAEKAVEDLGKRLRAYFPDQPVRVILSDGIVADAAAGADRVKLKEGTMFSSRDIDILEVHEGWVHVGTALNGQKQPYATWLAKGPPCVTAIQEGLATLMEMIAFVTYPTRARRLINRLLACHKAEKGANVLEIYDFFRSNGISDEDSLSLTERIYRGGDGRGAPFTKEVAYCKGFILIFNFMRAALMAGKVHYLPTLFVGKVALEDIPALYQGIQDGHVLPPTYLPKQFSDLNALATWMCYSNFFNRIHLEKIYDFYAPIFGQAKDRP